MVKNSFTLLETLLSIFVLSLMLVNFGDLYSQNKSLDELYIELNASENNFNKDDYSNVEESTKFLQVKLDKTQNIQVKVQHYLYKDQNIKLEKFILNEK